MSDVDLRYVHPTEIYVVRACYNDDATGIKPLLLYVL